MKKLNIFLFILAIVFSFTSCELNDESTIDGHDLTTGPIIVGWANASITESYFEDLGTIDKNYPIDVLGGGDGYPTEKEVTLNVTVDTEKTTAVGGEYTLGATTVKIPTGKTFANLPIGINTASFSASNPTKLVLNIATSVDGFVVSSLAKQMTVNFVGCKSELSNYNYLVTTVRDDGAQYGPVIEPLLMESVNKFMTYGVGTWDPQLNPGHGVRFEDICGSLSIADQNLADMYSNEVKGVSITSVDENGNFTLHYSIGFNAGTRTYKATYIKQ